MFGKNAGNFQLLCSGVTENAGMENARAKRDTGKPETDTH